MPEWSDAEEALDQLEIQSAFQRALRCLFFWGGGFRRLFFAWGGGFLGSSLPRVVIPRENLQQNKHQHVVMSEGPDLRVVKLKPRCKPGGRALLRSCKAESHDTQAPNMQRS